MLSPRIVVPVVLLTLLAMLHAQLWQGRGSMPYVQEMRQKIATQKEANVEALAANQRIGSEVKDLKEGLNMVEEKARSELGMVKPGEIFVQYTQR